VNNKTISEQDKAIQCLIDRDLNILARSNNYLSLQFKKIEKHLGKRILEIGAGIGNHTDKIIKRKPELLIALEKEDSFCKVLDKKFNGQINVLRADLQDIESYSDQLKIMEIDTIIAINVLEHIPQDINCLRSLADILSKKGRLILIVPAFQFLYSNLDSKYGHYRRYSKNIFTLYANKLNLTIIENDYFNMVGWIAWLVSAKIFRADKMSSRGMFLLNKIYTLQNILEEKLPFNCFGLSLIGVFEKNDD
jgi:phospholipid N-methyltransferase